ncbi:MAG: hypothetical protein PHU85_05200 [Phycisphaerae bacterium]|nr:hypothetical protein [Phycisphaerae bacterium]
MTFRKHPRRLGRDSAVGPRMEGLEGRAMLAGNVTAAIVGGNLVITGDAANNVIEVDQSVLVVLPGQVRVQSGWWGSATTINGGAAPVILEGFTGDVRITLNDGDDWVMFSDSDFPRDVTVNGGNGNNQVDVNGVTVERNLSVRNGPGNENTLVYGGANVRGNLTVANKAGDDAFSMAGGSIVNGNVSLSNGAGQGNTTLDNSIVNGNLTVKNQAGDDTFSMAAGAIVNGNASLSNGAGQGNTTLDGSHVHVNLTVRNAAGLDTFLMDNASTVDGNAAISNGEGGSNTTVRFKSVVAGTFTLRSGGGNDGFTMLDATINGAARIDSGAGADAVTIDDSILGGAFTLNSGADNDMVNIEQIFPGPVTTFGGKVAVKTGAGNDVVRIGVPGVPGESATFNQQSTWDGGAGADQIIYLPAGNVFAIPELVKPSFETIL